MSTGTDRRLHHVVALDDLAVGVDVPLDFKMPPMILAD